MILLTGETVGICDHGLGGIAFTFLKVSTKSKCNFAGDFTLIIQAISVGYSAHLNDILLSLSSFSDCLFSFWVVLELPASVLLISLKKNFGHQRQVSDIFALYLYSLFLCFNIFE